MPHTAAIYPGTFDPMTNAHMDILERSLAFFDTVIFAIAPNPSKQPDFTTEERVLLARNAITEKGLKGAIVEPFEGLLVNYAKHRNIRIIIRGLRAVSDFEYEFQLALMNRKLAPEIETIYMMPSEAYTFLSSHMVKEVGKLGGDISTLVPPNVYNAMQQKYHLESR